MKKVFFAVMLNFAFALSLIGQRKQVKDSIFPEVNGEIEYYGIVELDSTYSKNDLFLNAKQWIVTNYKNANAVIQMDDKESGILICKGLYSETWVQSKLLNMIQDVKVRHTIEIKVKDGKYMYKISDINCSYFDSKTYKESISFKFYNYYFKGVGKGFNEFRQANKLHLENMVLSIKNAMAKKGNANW